MATANPTAVPDRSKAALGLAIGAALVTIALTSVAFWLSYAALHDLAVGHHLAGDRAWAWPATLDSFVGVGELLVLRASLMRRVDWFAVTLTALGSIGSIALNVVSVGARVDLVTQIVAAVPPVAALLAFTALMRQLHRALAPAAPVGPEPERVPVERAEQPLTPVNTTADAPLPAMPPMPALPPAVVYADPRCQIIRALYRPGHRPETAEISAALTAAGYVASGGLIRASLRREVEAREPHLAPVVQLTATAP